jgi:hypothetical protein
MLSQNPSQLQDNCNSVNNEDGDYDEDYGNIGTVDMVNEFVIKFSSFPI